VRIIAATHRELKAEVQAGRFREDLFYRLHVFPIRVPALRERREDIPALAAHFLAKNAARLEARHHRDRECGDAGIDAYNWPGNVRELENAIERAVAIATGRELDIRDLPLSCAGRKWVRFPPRCWSGCPTTRPWEPRATAFHASIWRYCCTNLKAT